MNILRGPRPQKLPEYRSPSSYDCDETDSRIDVVWRTDDGTITQTLDGRYASELATLALRIAQDAYDAAQTQPASEDREVSDMAELTRFYWTQSAMTQDRSFQFAIGRGQQSMIGFLPAHMDKEIVKRKKWRLIMKGHKFLKVTGILMIIASIATIGLGAVTCPYCGATTTPDASGCCEYCGGAVNG